MTRLRVELYGRLKEQLGETLELEVPADLRADELLSRLARQMGRRGRFLQGSVLATENEILEGTMPVPASGRLALLPPVCGG